jgi:hypothetical protein
MTNTGYYLFKWDRRYLGVLFDYLVVDTILQSYILATFFFQFQCPLSAANIHPSPIRQCLSYVLLMMNWQLFWTQRLFRHLLSCPLGS